ncbi:carboxylesterase family protein [Mycobacterium sp. B14F4]|uniref:carboxylesterase/lipase family protein n=1 Tax=Mycobacterium sp. B14F4 TaxID=3153565 RepID=UPI00325F11CB
MKPIMRPEWVMRFRSQACRAPSAPTSLLSVALVCALLLTGCSDNASTTYGSSPEIVARVTISDGELEGSVVGGARQFLGIPFAKPPVGDLRFKLPQKNDPWRSKRDATQWGNRCAQRASAVLMSAASEHEDCLYLNVWAPEPAPAEPLPVMVWIHGGGNENWSASEPVPYASDGYLYSGQVLAESGVVVVSVNYRLGVFGFLADPVLAREGGSNPGNQGLFDQVMALEWVKNNIADFGGDPNRVTIFGQSAGATDVCFHVASPITRPFFRAAIGQSGGCTLRTTTAAEGAATAAGFAHALGCDDIACLRGKSVSELLATPNDGSPAPVFGPVVDGVFLPDQPRALYDRGEIAKVPYLLGSNSDEGTMFFTRPITDAREYTAALVEAFPRAGETSADSGERVQPIEAMYPVRAFPNGQPTPTTAAVARVIGDARLVCPTYDTAVRAAAAGSPVWMYNFSIGASRGGLGAAHGSELPFVFGTAESFEPLMQAVAERIQRYWINMAQSGNPNRGDDTDWPRFSGAAPVRLDIGATDNTVFDFRVKECEFWRGVYDRGL